MTYNVFGGTLSLTQSVSHNIPPEWSFSGVYLPVVYTELTDTRQGRHARLNLFRTTIIVCEYFLQ